jgi:hypothetical protein
VEEGGIQLPMTYLMPRCTRCLAFVIMPSLSLLTSSSNNGNGIQLVVIAGNMLGDNVWAFPVPSIAADTAIIGLFLSPPPQRQLLLGHTASILTGLSNTLCYHNKDRCSQHQRLILIAANDNKRVHVSHFPDAHDMRGYLIGHALFVLTIDATAVLLDSIVGVGDGNGSK